MTGQFSSKQAGVVSPHSTTLHSMVPAPWLIFSSVMELTLTGHVTEDRQPFILPAGKGTSLLYTR